MARIAGVNIPTQKKLGTALTYIYGIGKKLSSDVCKVANVDSNSRVQDLSESEIKSISDVISSSHNVEGDLRREVSGNIKRLKDLGAYRGVRPVVTCTVADTTFERFKTFSSKLVMLTSNTSSIPEAKQLRIIALQA